MEDRRSRYMISQRNEKQQYGENFKLNLKFDITELDLMCAYIVSNNRSIRRTNIINMRNVLSIMDMSAYSNDPECLSRIDFINKGIDARINKNLMTSDMIIRDITGGMGSGNYVTLKELNNTEVEWINTNMSEILKYAHFQVEAESGLALLTQLKSSDYGSRGKVVSDLEDWVVRVQNKLRKSKADNAEDLTFSLMGENFKEAMIETHRQVTNPANKLVFGTQALNLLTGGGVQAGKVYTLLGLPGEGKSATLLDMSIQIKKYNRNYVCKDPTKRPCVVLFLMENSVKETIERLFSMCIQRNIEDYTEEQAMDVFLNNGIHVADDDPIDLIIKFKPHLSVDTSYMYTMIDDLEDEGYEVICILQDYLKRIRSVEGTFGGDLRQQLGAVINEFKVCATLKNIPIITASQLNRDATSSVDNARLKNKSDLVRLIGRSNVGESNLILENSDWIGMIAPEVNPMNGERFLGMLRVKSRYRIPDGFSCAFMPYIGQSIKLIEDALMPVPVHKITMRSEEDIMLNNGMSSNIAGINKVKTFTEMDSIILETDNNIDNIFENASAVAAMSYENRPIINGYNNYILRGYKKIDNKNKVCMYKLV